MVEILIRSEHGMGKTRSQQEEQLRKEWGPTMNDENLDKLRFMEKKTKEATGSTKNFISQADIDEVK